MTPTTDQPSLRLTISGVEYNWEDLTNEGKTWLLNILFR